MPKNKKDKMRFTLRMNSDDPIQAYTAMILNTKGHGISNFVAHAVASYMGGEPDELRPASPALSLQSRNAPASQREQEAPPVQANNPQLSKKKEEPTPDIMLAMLDGMGDLK